MIFLASTGPVRIPAVVHPGWLYLRKTATVPGTSLTGSGAPRASLAVEITQSSIRRQGQSRGKKVLHAVAALEVDPSPPDVKAINRNPEVIKQIHDREIC